MVLDLLQSILKSPELEYTFKRGTTDSTTGRRFCEPCQSRLEAVDEKLYALLKEINALLRIRADAKELFNQHHDYVSRHLPAEITSHIFTIYTEDFNSNFNPRDPIVERGGPLLLAAVSRSWREIAFATPNLWNTINILIPSIDKLPPKVELTKQWLDRSRQRPLYLSFVYVTLPRQAKPKPDPLIPLFSALRSVAPRWYKLVLAIPPGFYSTFLGEVTCAPILDTLTLVDKSPAECEFYLPHTPSLKHLYNRSYIPSSLISIDWSNLTTFEADCLSIDEFFGVFRLVGRLKSFRSGAFIEDPGLYPPQTTAFTHSNLKELYLETGDDISPSELEALFDLAAFPSLEKFGYESSRDRFFPNRALQSLFNRSRCQLTHLDFSGELQNGTSDDIISILSDLPTITHLGLEANLGSRPTNAVMSDKLLQMLTPTRPGEATPTDRLLPRLESLEFMGYKVFSWTCLANLVGAATSDGEPNSPTTSGQGRAGSIRCISFTVYFLEEREVIDVHSVARFKAARDAGISIDILNEELGSLLPPSLNVNSTVGML